MSPNLLLRQWLSVRLEPKAHAWFKEASREIADDTSTARFAALFARASRHAKALPLDLTEKERKAARKALDGWNPERWEVREATRVALLLSRHDLPLDSGAVAIEELFRYADEGEQRALLRSLALLPEPQRFLARARAGCRTNMKSVFEAAALDTPYPVTYFDEDAWCQAVIKCLFVGAPLWRMHGLDTRLSPELARMALDLADERRSAGRPIPHELWLCLGEHAGQRGLEALMTELDPENPHTLGRRGAVLGLARSGAKDRLAVLAESDADPLVRQSAAEALGGASTQLAMADFE